MIHPLEFCPATYGDGLLGCVCGRDRKGYIVTMKDNASGEVVKCPMRDWVWEEGSEFLWSEGNWSCDCNRLYEFREGKGLPRMPEDDRGPYCKGNKQFQVLGIHLKDGTLVYEAEAWPLE